MSEYLENEVEEEEVEVSTCYECGCEFGECDEKLEREGDIYCEDCYFEKFSVCDHCGETHEVDLMTWHEDELFCQDCIDQNFTTCDDCGNLHRDCDITHIDGNDVCDNCRMNNYVTCERCGDYAHVDNSYYSDELDENFCSDYCRDSEESERCASIRSYNYKPDPEFFGSDTRLFLGVELEVEQKDWDADDENEVAQEIINNNTEVYCKHDGSLDDGFEIVTHPCTLDYHKNSLDWENIISNCLKGGYVSHNNKNCGLHVHLSKKGLGENREEIEINTAKMIIFIERFWDQTLKFSRRTQSQINQWAKRYLEDQEIEAIDFDKMRGKTSNSGRYRTVNIQNSSTVELRFFRGTLKIETLMASLEFSVALVDIVKNSSLEEILTKDFSFFMDYFEKYDYITDYMKKRGIIIE
jgi:hypothetical protein